MKLDKNYGQVKPLKGPITYDSYFNQTDYGVNFSLSLGNCFIIRNVWIKMLQSVFESTVVFA